MVSYLAGVCDLCQEPGELATPEECAAAGLELDAAVCVTCLRRMTPAAGDTVRIANPGETAPGRESAVVAARAPLVPPAKVTN